MSKQAQTLLPFDRNCTSLLRKPFLSRRAAVWLLLGILLLAAGLRLMKWYMEPVLPRDGIKYCHWAETWGISGQSECEDSIGVPPLYIFQVACLVRCGIPTAAAATGINIFWGVLAVMALYGHLPGFAKKGHAYEQELSSCVFISIEGNS